MRTKFSAKHLTGVSQINVPASAGGTGDACWLSRLTQAAVRHALDSADGSAWPPSIKSIETQEKSIKSKNIKKTNISQESLW